jgi:hypothetical protein
MRGTMVIIRPGDTDLPEVREFARPVTLEELQTAVGGHVEVVPMFNTLAFAATVLNCVAFCNEEGKLDHLPVNEGATMQWERALKRTGHSLRDDKTRIPKDWLVGNIAVLFGDREFMGSL